MARKDLQVCKSKQINSCMQMVLDYDQPLITIAEKLSALFTGWLNYNSSILKRKILK